MKSYNADIAPIDLHFSNAADTIRIQRITISNMKSVEFGEMVFSGQTTFPSHIEGPSIIGLYGQNGSGKSTFIEAMNIVQTLVSGGTLDPNFYGQDLVRQGADKASIEVVFEKQSAGSDIVKLYTYSFDLVRDSSNNDEFRNSVCVCNESLLKAERNLAGSLVSKTRRIFEEETAQKRMSDNVLATSTGTEATVSKYMNGFIQGTLFTTPEEIPTEVRDVFLEHLNPRCYLYRAERHNSVLFDSLSSAASTARTDYRVFASRVISLDALTNDVLPLQRFAENRLFVIGAKLFNNWDEYHMPFFFGKGVLNIYRKTHLTGIDPGYLSYLKKDIAALNKVLANVIHGLMLEIEVTDPDPEPDNTIGIELYTSREGSRIRLIDESDGIQRIIYALDIFLLAFNNTGVTAIIDEFDAGIFEFLLGELLQIFEEEGKGQFIFTSHNLRPLEVLSKRCIWFTTANPLNRYTRLKYLGKTNNLRDVYFRQILRCDQEDPIYDSEKRYQIVAAMKEMRLSATEPQGAEEKDISQNPEEV